VRAYIRFITLQQMSRNFDFKASTGLVDCEPLNQGMELESFTLTDDFYSVYSINYTEYAYCKCMMFSFDYPNKSLM